MFSNRCSIENPRSSIPPRFSISQGSFFRTRDPNKELYPSHCYANPDVPALHLSPYNCRSNPIQFIGVNIASFDENDPSTALHRLSPEVVSPFLFHIAMLHRVRFAPSLLHRGNGERRNPPKRRDSKQTGRR